jgi:hypothetical protein
MKKTLMALIAGATLAMVGGSGPGSAEAGEPPSTGQRLVVPSKTSGGGKDFARSSRDLVRELRGQLIALERRVAKLERARSNAGPATDLGARLDALEGAVAVDANGSVTLSSTGVMSIEGSLVDIKASTVHTRAGTTTFNDVVNVNTLNAQRVVAEEMAPGAGNVW